MSGVLITQGRGIGQGYDGTANAGLVEISTQIPLDWQTAAREICPIIRSIELYNGFAEELDYDLYLVDAGGAITALQRFTIERDAAPGFSFLGCDIKVPRSSNGIPYNLILTATPNPLTVAASFNVLLALGNFND